MILANVFLAHLNIISLFLFDILGLFELYEHLNSIVLFHLHLLFDMLLLLLHLLRRSLHFRL